MTELDIGYLLPTRDAVVAGFSDPRPLVDLAAQAETQGFDSVWAGESPLARPRADALTLLGAVAARTGHVRIGTAVLLPALRNPVLLAHQLATLDGLSGGRLVVGAGSGFPYPPTRRQFEAAGVDYRHRVKRTEETIEAMRELWGGAGRPASFAGSNIRFDDVAVEPAPAQAGGPPIWLAGSGPAAERRVGRLGDGWLPYPPDVADYAGGLERVREAAGGAGRRPPAAALYATVALAGSGGGAQEDLRRSVERYYDAPLEALGRIQAIRAGRPDELAAWLWRYVEAGARHLVLRVAGAEPAAGLGRLARELLPRLRELGPVPA